MKAILIVMLLIPSVAICQYNFVPNFSFEDSVICPTPNYDPLPKPWYVPSNIGGTHGFYCNSCSNYITTQVPVNRVYGYPNFQYAKTGSGYSGCDYFFQSSAFPPNARSYLQVKLTDSLEAGKCYYCGYWVSLPNPNKRACNNISMLLTKQAVYSDTIANPYGTGLIAANPQVVNYGNPIITDTMNWVKVGAVVKGTGGEQFITLGNFKTDSLTTIKMVSTTGPESAAYLIDDVFVIPLDSLPLKADAGPDTTIALGDSVFIGSLTNGITNITWHDTAGNIINTSRPGFYVTPATTTTYIIQQTVCGYTSRDTAIVTVNLMPLHWLSFTAAQLSSSLSFGEGRGEVLLNWQTASEINVSHINIQRSFRGTNEFENIGQVTAKNKPYNEYSYVDDKLGGVSKGTSILYRLQSVDKDGMRSYSEIKRVRFENATAEITIYPNPANFFVFVSGKRLQQIELISSTGSLISKQKIISTNTKISLQNLSKGIYFIKATNDKGEITVRKIVKAN